MRSRPAERRREPAFAGDQLVAVDRLGHEDGLEHAVLADARCERRRAPPVELSAGLVRVRPDALDRDLDSAARAGRALRDQRGEAAAKALCAFGSNCHDTLTSAADALEALDRDTAGSLPA